MKCRFFKKIKCNFNKGKYKKEYKAYELKITMINGEDITREPRIVTININGLLSDMVNNGLALYINDTEVEFISPNQISRILATEVFKVDIFTNNLYEPRDILITDLELNYDNITVESVKDEYTNRLIEKFK